KPDLILADDPTAGLSPESGRRVIRLLGEMRRGGAGIIITSQDETLTTCVPCAHWRLQMGRLYPVEQDEPETAGAQRRDVPPILTAPCSGRWRSPPSPPLPLRWPRARSTAQPPLTKASAATTPLPASSHPKRRKRSPPRRPCLPTRRWSKALRP